MVWFAFSSRFHSSVRSFLNVVGHFRELQMSVFTLEKELKACGHYCFPSTTKNCCPCMDLRPHLEGNTYPVYIDGVGWADTGARDDGYCPVCNPKNFDEWNARIEKTRLEKALLKEQQLLDEEKKQRSLEEDRKRAAAVSTGLPSTIVVF